MTLHRYCLYLQCQVLITPTLTLLQWLFWSRHPISQFWSGNANTSIGITTCNQSAKIFCFSLPEVPDEVFCDDAHCLWLGCRSRVWQSRWSHASAFRTVFYINPRILRQKRVESSSYFLFIYCLTLCSKFISTCFGVPKRVSSTWEVRARVR